MNVMMKDGANPEYSVQREKGIRIVVSTLESETPDVQGDTYSDLATTVAPRHGDQRHWVSRRVTTVTPIVVVGDHHVGSEKTNISLRGSRVRV